MLKQCGGGQPYSKKPKSSTTCFGKAGRGQMCTRTARQDAQQHFAAVGWEIGGRTLQLNMRRTTSSSTLPVHVRGQRKNISVRSGARGSLVQNAQSVELHTEVEHVGGSEKEDRTVNTSFSLGVQLLIKRGATTPSSLNKVFFSKKNKKTKIGAGRQALLQFSWEIT